MATRAQVVAEAEKLLGVKWVHQGRSAQHGVDCVGVPAVVALNLGLISQPPRADYPRRPDGSFLKRFRASGLIEILPGEAKPGDVLVFVDHNAPAPCHCGILTEFRGEPAVIHAYAAARKVTIETLSSAAQSVGVWTHAFKFPNLTE